MERILRLTGLNAFSSNFGIPHTSGSWEYGRRYLLFSLSVGFVIWRKIAIALKTLWFARTKSRFKLSKLELFPTTDRLI